MILKYFELPNRLISSLDSTLWARSRMAVLMFFTSKFAAYPKTISWKMGGKMRVILNRLSLRTWINSLKKRNRTRLNIFLFTGIPLPPLLQGGI
jgi:hypothetical protein